MLELAQAVPVLQYGLVVAMILGTASGVVIGLLDRSRLA